MNEIVHYLSYLVHGIAITLDDILSRLMLPSLNYTSLELTRTCYLACVVIQLLKSLGSLFSVKFFSQTSSKQ